MSDMPVRVENLSKRTMRVLMSSEVLVPQAALTDRDRCDSTAVGDEVAISVRDVGKMYYLYDRSQDRLK